MRVPLVLAAASVLALSGCGVPGGDLVVPMRPHIAARSDLALAQSPPRNVALPAFAEATADPGRIGARSISGQPAGEVLLTPPPGPLLHDAFAAELRRAGHTIASEAGATIEGKVIGFAIRNSPTAFGWQMVLDAGIAITARNGEAMVNHAYSTRCADRAVSTPGAGAIEALVAHCVDDLAIQFASDSEVAHVLGARSGRREERRITTRSACGVT
jgi:hypothetical protein